MKPSQVKTGKVYHTVNGGTFKVVGEDKKYDVVFLRQMGREMFGGYYPLNRHGWALSMKRGAFAKIVTWIAS
ncbi:MAG: hypothetical protein KQJ78_23070 [Deltaproteobacteria bacterium]|nr:hypothetical protein [Deltaproteobacteria bacterium]